MTLDTSNVSSFPRFPRLLIAETNFSTTESLISSCEDNRIDVEFELCSSHTSAMRKLLAASYQLIICGARLAQMNDCILVKQAQEAQPFVPFVLTVSKPEKEAARRVLEEGAFDCILNPLDYGQTSNTIRMAFRHSKLRNLIVRKEAALERYRQHLADYPHSRESIEESFNRLLLAFEQTISAVERSIALVEVNGQWPLQVARPWY